MEDHCLVGDPQDEENSLIIEDFNFGAVVE